MTIEITDILDIPNNGFRFVVWNEINAIWEFGDNPIKEDWREEVER